MRACAFLGFLLAHSLCLLNAVKGGSGGGSAATSSSGGGCVPKHAFSFTQDVTANSLPRFRLFDDESDSDDEGTKKRLQKKKRKNKGAGNEVSRACARCGRLGAEWISFW